MISIPLSTWRLATRAFSSQVAAAVAVMVILVTISEQLILAIAIVFSSTCHHNPCDVIPECQVVDAAEQIRKDGLLTSSPVRFFPSFSFPLALSLLSTV